MIKQDMAKALNELYRFLSVQSYTHKTLLEEKNQVQDLKTQIAQAECSSDIIQIVLLGMRLLCSGQKSTEDND